MEMTAGCQRQPRYGIDHVTLKPEAGTAILRREKPVSERLELRLRWHF
jgi:hypothetical protein